MEERKQRRLALTLFALYCTMMLWLLFDREGGILGEDYWLQVQQNLNLEPFHTIKLFWNVLDREEYRRHAIINLGGNIGMFIPLGFFLPALWRNMRKWWRTWLAVLLIMTVVELTQLFTLRGSCDVDDLILNVSGAAIGYGIFWLVQKIQKQ